MWFAGIRTSGAIRPRTGSNAAERFYRKAGMKFEGSPTFISATAYFDASKDYSLITLSEGCNISAGVRILTHDWSPYCVLASMGVQAPGVGKLAEVRVGPYAFIGMGALLMPGSSIGRGAIVGAGAVVRGEVPDYAICIGNPAKVIGDSREYVAQKYPEAWAATGSGQAPEAG